MGFNLRLRLPRGRAARALVTAGAIAAAWPAMTLAPQAQSAAGATSSQAVTFSRDIAPILQKHCQECHRPGSLAPMSLITYEDVRPWARSIKTRTSLGPRSGVMPPWYADKSVGIKDYQNDPSLSGDEIRTIAAWVDTGARQGNPADMPPAREFNDDWRIGTPDLIVESPVVEMTAQGSDWWGTIAAEIPTGLTEDRYVAALQAREVTISMDGDAALKSIGGRFIIHHWGFRAAGPRDEQLVLGEGERPPRVVGTTHEVGRNEDVFDAESARLMEAQSKVVFGAAHLHPNGRATKARLQVGFKFHPRGWKPSRAVRARGLFGNSMNIDLRPMEANQKFEGFTVLPDNARIVSFEPHMHAAGVRMCLDAIYGSSTTFETLSCVGYDHSWVRTYAFARDAQPLLPRGTIVRITGYFDNTPSNRNVADPRNWSGNGHRSIDNMMNELGEVQLLTDQEFQDAMVERRRTLGLKEGQTIVGCPLCGVAGRPLPSRTTQQQNQ